MAEIMEVFEDIKKATGDKGFYILIGVAVLFGIYNFTKGTGNQETVSVSVAPTYPDVDRNADVVMDTIQDSIEYSEGIILEALENQESMIQENNQQLIEQMNKNFTATNDYINKGQTATEKNSIAIAPSNATPAKKSGTKKAPADAVNFYSYKTATGLNTGTSIVDALKAIGVNSSFSNREKIAEANGISNYTGTATQNISLLNKLKAGKLIKV